VALDVLLRFDAWLERYSGPNLLRAILISGFSLILVAYGLTGYLLDISRFSPDSWSYYELARTGLTGSSTLSIPGAAISQKLFLLHFSLRGIATVKFRKELSIKMPVFCRCCMSATCNILSKPLFSPCH
jgi:hypothetical protein